MVSKNGIRKAVTSSSATAGEVREKDFEVKALSIAHKHPTPRDAHIEWRCAGTSTPEDFHPTSAEEYERAKQLCAGCPARLMCLSLGLDRDEWGVWGGVLLEGGKRRDAPRGPGRPRKAPVVEAVALA